MSYTKPVKQIIALLVSALFVAAVAFYYNDLFLYSTVIAKKIFSTYPFSPFLIPPLGFLLSAYLCKRFSPNSAGSGTTHVISALSLLDKKGDADVSQYVGFRILLMTIFGSLICACGGGALGREGPIVQIAASIVLLIALYIKKFLPDIDLRKWIIAGGAAGFATIFGAPIAGIIFSIEELTQFRTTGRLQLFDIKIVILVLLSVCISRTVYLPDPVFVLNDVVVPHSMNFYIGALCLAVTAGSVAALMKYLIGAGTRWQQSISGKAWYLVPVFFGLIVGAVIFCVGTYSYGSGVVDVKLAMLSPEEALPISGLFGRFTNIISAMCAGCAGGILLPSLAMGAYIGSALNVLWPLVDVRIFISIGMAAYLGAMLRAPLTAAVLIAEITSHPSLAPPLIVCAFISSWVFKKFSAALEVIGRRASS